MTTRDTILQYYSEISSQNHLKKEMSLNSLFRTHMIRQTKSWYLNSHHCLPTTEKIKTLLVNVAPLSSWYARASLLQKPVEFTWSISTSSRRSLSVKSSKSDYRPTTSAETDTSLLQKVLNETNLLLQFLREIIFVDVPLLLPRIFAFVATIQLTTEYGFQTVSCEGPSMEPTIIDGSYSCILIERWSHRIFGLEKDDQAQAEAGRKRLSLSEQQHAEESWYELARGLWEQHFASGLQHGDVIILLHPAKEATICKRIIGMPGDVIVRTDGGESWGDEEKKYRVVPPGHLWIEGDNTRNSLDSRSYGTVPASLVIGKVICRLWPLRDYVSLGVDANGIEHWRRVSARIRRGERPVFDDQKGIVNGSYVLPNESGGGTSFGIDRK